MGSQKGGASFYLETRFRVKILFSRANFMYLNCDL